MNKKKILYVQTSGIDTPERLYSPFILAQTAKAMDIDASIYFLGKDLNPFRRKGSKSLCITVVKNGEAEKIKIGNFPTLKEVMDHTLKLGVELLVCEQSTQLIGLKRGDFIKEVKIVGAATLNDMVLDADGTMWF